MQAASTTGRTTVQISDNTKSKLRGRFGSSTSLLRAANPCHCRSSLTCRGSRLKVSAIGSGGPDDKKSLSREEEPQEYWQTAAEKKGQNPLQDPLAIIGILAIFLPFIILAIAIGTGVVDTSGGR